MPIGHPIDSSPRETIQCPQNVGLNWIHPWFAHPPNRQRPYIVSDTTPTQRGHLGVTPDGLGLEESGGRKHWLSSSTASDPSSSAPNRITGVSVCVQLVTKKARLFWISACMIPIQGYLRHRSRDNDRSSPPSSFGAIRARSPPNIDKKLVSRSVG